MNAYYRYEFFYHTPRMLFEFFYQMIKIGSILGVFLYSLLYIMPSSFFIQDVNLQIDDHIIGKQSSIYFYRDPVKDIRYSFDQKLRQYDGSGHVSDICRHVGSVIMEVRADNMWVSRWDDFWRPYVCEPKAGLYYVHVVGHYTLFGVWKEIHYKSNLFSVRAP